ncbi:MAG: hypothetical protein ABIT71_02790 [Vicinamibacteraceae bacterium]
MRVLRGWGWEETWSSPASVASRPKPCCGAVQLKRAIVVPDTKLAYLARLAFGWGHYRVFYNDRAAAVRWLTDADG